MKRILVVEDEFILSFVTTTVLERLGYEVAGVMNSAQATLEAVRRQPPDLILMDIQLGDVIDGIELMKQIRGFSDVPVLYLTGNTDTKAKARAAETKPIGFLSKPIKEEELLQVLEKHFGSPATA